MVSSLPLLLLLLFGSGFSSGMRLGNGGYEEWRLGTATYIKEFLPHPLNDGMYVCVFSLAVGTVLVSGTETVPATVPVPPLHFLWIDRENSLFFAPSKKRGM
jgi:hypothetical protein